MAGLFHSICMVSVPAPTAPSPAIRWEKTSRRPAAHLRRLSQGHTAGIGKIKVIQPSRSCFKPTGSTTRYICLNQLVSVLLLGELYSDERPVERSYVTSRFEALSEKASRAGPALAELFKTTLPNRVKLMMFAYIVPGYINWRHLCR